MTKIQLLFLAGVVAQVPGAGRETDLLLYLAIVTDAFAMLVLYAPLRDARGAGEPS